MEKEVKFAANITKVIATAQAVIAPGLMIIGHITGNKILRNFGAVWCGLITLDTARTTSVSVNNMLKIVNLQDETDKLEHMIYELES